jgi:HPt (histidine-containing phosphotransfer) domain-containing protein
MSRRLDEAASNERWEFSAMTQQRDSSLQTAMDLSDLLMRVDNDHDLVIELIAIFKRKYPPTLLLLQESVAREDTNRVEITSHTLKGMLLCLSATRAAALAERLEQMGRDGKTSRLSAVLTLFEEEVANLLPELDGYATKAKL